MIMRQNILPLNMPERMGERDFIVSSHNQMGYHWLHKWPHWQDGMFSTILWGSIGSGKTHLVRFWGEKNSATFLSKCIPNSRETLQTSKIIICDNIDKWGDLEWTFHLLNIVQEYNSYLVLTMEDHPNSWAKSLPDLHSRLLRSMIIELGLPNDTAIRDLLNKRFEDNGLTIDEATMAFIIKRTSRDYQSLHKLVNDLNQASASLGKAITIPLVKTTLQW